MFEGKIYSRYGVPTVVYVKPNADYPDIEHLSAFNRHLSTDSPYHILTEAQNYNKVIIGECQSRQKRKRKTKRNENGNENQENMAAVKFETRKYFGMLDGEDESLAMKLLRVYLGEQKHLFVREASELF